MGQVQNICSIFTSTDAGVESNFGDPQRNAQTEIKVNAVSHVAKKILDGIDCKLVKKCYNHCFKGEIVDWI